MAVGWKLIKARPMKYTGPSLNGKGTDVAVEELVLASERHRARNGLTMAAARAPGLYFETPPRRCRRCCRAWTWRPSSASPPPARSHVPVPIEGAGRFRDLFGPRPAAGLGRRARRAAARPPGTAVEALLPQRRPALLGRARGGRDDGGASPVHPPRVAPGGRSRGHRQRTRPCRRELVRGAGRRHDPGARASPSAVDRPWRPSGLASGAGDYRLELDAEPVRLVAGDLLEVIFGPGRPWLYLFVATAGAVTGRTLLTGSPSPARTLPGRRPPGRPGSSPHRAPRRGASLSRGREHARAGTAGSPRAGLRRRLAGRLSGLTTGDRSSGA